MLQNTNLSYVLFCASVYALSLTVIYQNALEDSRRTVPRNGSTLLVIAHPDDEAMFFGPVIIRKLEPAEDQENTHSEDQKNNQNDRKQLAKNFHLLCITSGNQYGVGNRRKSELIASAVKLGLRSSNVRIMDDVRWLDGEHQVWHQQSLQQLLMDEILSKNITELITFDEYGVSGHANHRTLYKVVRSINLKVDYVKFYVLRSINLLQKYLAFLDFPFFYLLTGRDKANQIYLLDMTEYLRLVDAFRCHHSQQVWFRHLYAVFSKYMYVNVLSELDLEL